MHTSDLLAALSAYSLWRSALSLLRSTCYTGILFQVAICGVLCVKIKFIYNFALIITLKGVIDTVCQR
jgi:hypothetical protein